MLNLVLGVGVFSLLPNFAEPNSFLPGLGKTIGGRFSVTGGAMLPSWWLVGNANKNYAGSGLPQGLFGE